MFLILKMPLGIFSWEKYNLWSFLYNNSGLTHPKNTLRRSLRLSLVFLLKHAIGTLPFTEAEENEIKDHVVSLGKKKDHV